jgi:hypothetical protein
MSALWSTIQRIIRGFTQSPQANAGTVPHAGYGRFLPHPFQIIIRKSSYNSTLCNLSYWQRRDIKTPINKQANKQISYCCSFPKGRYLTAECNTTSPGFELLWSIESIKGSSLVTLLRIRIEVCHRKGTCEVRPVEFFQCLQNFVSDENISGPLALAVWVEGRNSSSQTLCCYLRQRLPQPNENSPLGAEGYRIPRQFLYEGSGEGRGPPSLEAGAETERGWGDGMAGLGSKGQLECNHL